MKKLFLWLGGIGVASMALVGCGGSNTLNSGIFGSNSHIRAVNLLYGQDNVSFLNNGAVQAAPGSLSYGQPSSYQSYDNSSRTLSFENGSTVVATIPSQAYQLSSWDTAYLVSNGSGGADAFTVQDNSASIPTGQAIVRTINAIDGSTAYDVYVSLQQGAPLNSDSQLASNLAYKGTVQYKNVAVATNTTQTLYVTVTPANSTTPIYSTQVPIQSGNAYSLVVTDGAAGTPSLAVVTDNKD